MSFLNRINPGLQDYIIDLLVFNYRFPIDSIVILTNKKGLLFFSGT